MNKTNFFKSIEKNPTSRTSIQKITINLIRNLNVQTGCKNYLQEKNRTMKIWCYHMHVLSEASFLLMILM